MDFFRRSEKRPTTPEHARILVPLLGEPAVDDPALKVAALLLNGQPDAEVSLLHVIEVPFERTLDAEDEAAVLRRGRGALASRGDSSPRRGSRRGRARSRPARRVRPSWTTPTSSAADLIVMGLRYKKRFGGQWDAGRTVPYVMRNSTAPVWCLRAETKELAHTT